MKDAQNTHGKKAGRKIDYLFISGSTYDKRDQVLLYHTINEDKDIRKLLKKAKTYHPHRSLLLIIILILSVVFNIFSNVAEHIMNQFHIDMNNAVGQIIYYGISLIALLLVVYDHIKQYRAVLVEVDKTTDYINLKKKKLLPKNPLDLWHLFPASIIDGQIALYAQQLLYKANTKSNDSCRIIFAGQPYAKHYFLDSFDICWSVESSKRPLKKRSIQCNFKKVYRKYATQSVIANAIDKMNKVYGGKNPKRQTSNYVFGLLFATRYFKQFLEKYCADVFKPNEKVYIDLDGIIEGNKEIVINTLRYFTNPTYFSFQKQDNVHYPITLHVKQFRVALPEDKKYFYERFQGKGKWNIVLKFFYDLYLKVFALKPIHIPVKRIFLKPYIDQQKELWFLNDLSNAKAATIILLGGAEQSLPQCHLLNRHRWTDTFDSQFNIGFAENEFDFEDSEHFNFLVGTEGFVYGRRYGQAITPDESPNRMNRNFAEKLQIELDGKKVIVLYGYHAISTKITASKFLLDAILHSGNIPMSECEQYFTQKGFVCPVITYRYMYENSDDWDTIKYFWDKSNPIDKPLIDPEIALKPFKTELSTILIYKEK